MTCCGHCQDAEDLFSPRTARRDLRRYRKRGPGRPTRLLLDSIRACWHPHQRSLLDIGGGVGAIQHELLQEGLERVTSVDASAAYLVASRMEAERQGHGDRITAIHGDFVQLAEGVPEADIVTLDRVICCYPDMERLVEASVTKARHVYGLVYPRERRLTRIGLGAGNLYFRLRRSEFRTYLHPARAVDALVRRHGFRRAGHAQTFFWRVVTYVSVAGASS